MSEQDRADMESAKADIRAILDRVVASVHDVNYENVRDLIPDDGLYFGSVAPVARGYDELYAQQFTKVWPNISDFRMLDISIHVAGAMAWATCLFESGGADPAANVKRRGRMTFIFEQRGDGWVMVHSHDSLFPTPPPEATS